MNRPQSNCAGERKKRKREEGVQAKAKAKRGEGPPLGAARPKGKNIVGLFWHTMHQPKEKKRNRRHGTYVALLHGNDSGRRKRSFAKAASPTRRHAPSSGSVAGERPRVSPRGQNQSTLRAPITPCHPYCAWAKGSIERHNRLVRTHHPKPTDFSKLSPHALTRSTTSSSTTPAPPESPPDPCKFSTPSHTPCAILLTFYKGAIPGAVNGKRQGRMCLRYAAYRMALGAWGVAVWRGVFHCRGAPSAASGVYRGGGYVSPEGNRARCVGGEDNRVVAPHFLGV